MSSGFNTMLTYFTAYIIISTNVMDGISICMGLMLWHFCLPNVFRVTWTEQACLWWSLVLSSDVILIRTSSHQIGFSWLIIYVTISEISLERDVTFLFIDMWVLLSMITTVAFDWEDLVTQNSTVSISSKYSIVSSLNNLRGFMDPIRGPYQIWMVGR